MQNNNLSSSFELKSSHITLKNKENNFNFKSHRLQQLKLEGIILNNKQSSFTFTGVWRALI